MNVAIRRMRTSKMWIRKGPEYETKKGLETQYE
jgi:hypothetical protein